MKSTVRSRSLFTLAATSVALALVSQSQALTINLNANASLTSNSSALSAFQRAANHWERAFDDNVTVNLDVGLLALSNGILGSTSSVQLSASYAGIRSLLIADELADPSGTLLAIPALPESMNFYVPGGSGLTLSGAVAATKANLKAIGISESYLDTNFGATDATINFSSNFNFDFDNTDGITAGYFDFESVAAHEIGHALGFVSVVDTVDYALDHGLSGSITPRILDLFRFDGLTGNPETLQEFHDFSRSLLPGGDAYFDVLTTEIPFSTGVVYGDGHQASHWLDNQGIGLMDPTLSPTEVSPISFADLTAFDAIGWDLHVPDAASTACLSLVGLTMLALAERRRSMR